MLSAPGASDVLLLESRTRASDRARPLCVVAFMHMFCIGMYIALVRGLYAPAGQFLPPFVPGHTISVWSFLREDALRIDRRPCPSRRRCS